MKNKNKKMRINLRRCKVFKTFKFLNALDFETRKIIFGIYICLLIISLVMKRTLRNILNKKNSKKICEN